MSEITESIIENMYYSKINLSKISIWDKDKYYEVENLPKVFFQFNFDSFNYRISCFSIFY